MATSKILRRGFHGALKRNFHCTNDEKGPVLRLFRGRKETALVIVRIDLYIHELEIDLGNVLRRAVLWTRKEGLSTKRDCNTAVTFGADGIH